MIKNGSFAVFFGLLLPIALATSCASEADFLAPCITEPEGGSCSGGTGVCALDSTGSLSCCRNSAVIVSSTARTTRSSTTCVDLLNPRTGVSDCPARVSLCTNALYKTLMTQQCPKTCGLCTSSSTCVDLVNAATGVSDCTARGLAGYCTRRYYTSLMKTQCPKTCGYC